MRDGAPSSMQSETTDLSLSDSSDENKAPPNVAGPGASDIPPSIKEEADPRPHKRARHAGTQTTASETDAIHLALDALARIIVTPDPTSASGYDAESRRRAKRGLAKAFVYVSEVIAKDRRAHDDAVHAEANSGCEREASAHANANKRVEEAKIAKDKAAAALVGARDKLRQAETAHDRCRDLPSVLLDLQEKVDDARAGIEKARAADEDANTELASARDATEQARVSAKAAAAERDRAIERRDAGDRHYRAVVTARQAVLEELGAAQATTPTVSVPSGAAPITAVVAPIAALASPPPAAPTSSSIRNATEPAAVRVDSEQCSAERFRGLHNALLEIATPEQKSQIGQLLVQQTAALRPGDPVPEALISGLRHIMGWCAWSRVCSWPAVHVEL